VTETTLKESPVHGGRIWYQKREEHFDRGKGCEKPIFKKKIPSPASEEKSGKVLILVGGGSVGKRKSKGDRKKHGSAGQGGKTRMFEKEDQPKSAIYRLR